MIVLKQCLLLLLRIGCSRDWLGLVIAYRCLNSNISANGEIFIRLNLWINQLRWLIVERAPFIYSQTVRVESLSASMEESDIHPGTISQEGKCAYICVLCIHFTCACMYLCAASYTEPLILYSACISESRVGHSHFLHTIAEAPTSGLSTLNPTWSWEI